MGFWSVGVLRLQTLDFRGEAGGFGQFRVLELEILLGFVGPMPVVETEKRGL